MSEKPTYLTRDGKARLEAELEDLITVGRRHVADRIAAAKAFAGLLHPVAEQDTTDFDKALARIDAAGAQGRTAVLIALNDYRVEMPLEDAERYDVLVARLLDGQPMAVRDKGPLFVIYPFDARAELRSAVYHARSAWQLRTIDVR